MRPACSAPRRPRTLTTEREEKVPLPRTHVPLVILVRLVVGSKGERNAVVEVGVRGRAGGAGRRTLDSQLVELQSYLSGEVGCTVNYISPSWPLSASESTQASAATP